MNTYNDKYHFLITLLLLKLCICFFNENIYLNFSTLGDSRGYLKSTLQFDFFYYFPEIIFNRTSLISFIYSIINFFFSKTLTPYIAAIISGIFFWVALKDYYKVGNKYFFWFIFLLPSFAVWTNTPGKELIVIFLYLLILNYTVKIIYNVKVNHFLYLIVIWFAFLIRPNYTLPYIVFYIVVLSKIYIIDIYLFPNKNLKLSLLIYLFLWSILTIIFLFIAFIVIYFNQEYFFEHIVRKSRNMFMAFDNMSRSMRNHGIDWYSIEDFFRSIFSRTLYSFSGPSLDYSLSRPVFLVYYFESLVINLTFIYIFVKLFFLKSDIKNYYYLLIFGYCTNLILLFLFHYPLGFFNVGSGFRYKQNIIPFLFFLPYMIISYNKNNNR